MLEEMKEERIAYSKALGAHLSELRIACGLTQADVARALGVSQQTIFAYELGDRRTSVYILTKIAELFGVTVQSLITFKPTKTSKRNSLTPTATVYAKRLQKLNKKDLKTVKRIIDVFLAQNKAAA